jgi:hypothetical protein
MLSVLVGLILQTPQYFVLEETAGEQAPVLGGTLIYTLELKIIGRKAKVLLDTKARALPYKMELVTPPKSMMEHAIFGLGRKATRVISDPEIGTVAYVKVLEIKRV